MLQIVASQSSNEYAATKPKTSETNFVAEFLLRGYPATKKTKIVAEDYIDVYSATKKYLLTIHFVAALGGEQVLCYKL